MSLKGYTSNVRSTTFVKCFVKCFDAYHFDGESRCPLNLQLILWRAWTAPLTLLGVPCHPCLGSPPSLANNKKDDGEIKITRLQKISATRTYLQHIKFNDKYNKQNCSIESLLTMYKHTPIPCVKKKFTSYSTG